MNRTYVGIFRDTETDEHTVLGITEDATEARERAFGVAHDLYEEDTLFVILHDDVTGLRIGVVSDPDERYRGTPSPDIPFTAFVEVLPYRPTARERI